MGYRDEYLEEVEARWDWMPEEPPPGWEPAHRTVFSRKIGRLLIWVVRRNREGGWGHMTVWVDHSHRPGGCWEWRLWRLIVGCGCPF